MRGLTLPFVPTKTYNPISVDLREKRRKEKKNFSLSLFTLSISPVSLFFFFSSLLTFIFHFLSFFFSIHGSTYLIRVCFFPETIYLFLIQFILNELSSSHFPTSKIFVKISFLKSLVTYHPKNRKNIPIVSEFDKLF